MVWVVPVARGVIAYAAKSQQEHREAYQKVKSMTEIKQKIEEYFVNYWHNEPVYFQGQETSAGHEFIVVSFIPLDSEITGFGGDQTRKTREATINVKSYCTNPTRCMILDDKVRAFLECYNVDNIVVGVGEPDGLGILDLEAGNGFYESSVNYNAIKQ